MSASRSGDNARQALGSLLESPFMNRRTFLRCGPGIAWGAPLIAAMQQPDKLEMAAGVLAQAATTGQVDAAVLYVRHRHDVFARFFGTARSVDALFLLGSISKPMTAAALMTLYDKGKFQLDDPVRKFLPEFTGAARDRITIRQLLTHVSGLPDQLPENAALRRRHAPLSEFVAGAVRTPLLFEPGSRYEYSSMAFLLASEVARRISGTEFPAFIEEAVFRPLEMKHSALGLGRFPLEATMRCQAEHAAPESGAGDPAAREWDWNSPYWRSLGSPWGGVHASAPDVARFLAEFLDRQGRAVRPETAAPDAPQSQSRRVAATRSGIRPRRPGRQPRLLGGDVRPQRIHRDPGLGRSQDGDDLCRAHDVARSG